MISEVGSKLSFINASWGLVYFRPTYIIYDVEKL